MEPTTQQEIKQWLATALRCYLIDKQKVAEAFAPYVAALGMVSTPEEDLAEFIEKRGTREAATWKRAICDLFEEIEATSQTVPIFGFLVRLARLLSLYDVMPVFAHRLRQRAFKTIDSPEKELLRQSLLELCCSLSGVSTAQCEAAAALDSLVDGGLLNEMPSASGNVFLALCRATPEQWASHAEG